MICSSCNSPLKTIEYQARSADEAQRSILRCPNCPLNIDDFTKGRVNVHLHLKRRQRIIESVPSIDSSDSTILRFVCGKTKLSNIQIDGSASDPVFATNYIDNNGHMFRHHHNGQWAGNAVSVLSTMNIAPNVKLLEIKVIRCTQSSHKKYRIFNQVMRDGKDYIINNDSVSLWSQIHDDKQIESKIYELYLLGFAPLTLFECIGQTTLQSLSNLTARAYDRYNVADYEHKFSDKPDGERFWLTKIGMVYLFSSRLTGHVIRGWETVKLIDNISSTTIGPIIDIEFMIGFNPKLIDILMDDKGKIATHQRTVDSINDGFNTMKCSIPSLSMIETRQFFDTLEETTKYRQELQYPTDGIVAIAKSGTDMFKIKDERSMELQLLDDGKLCTSDSVSLFSSSYHEIYDPGTILEIRFSMKDGSMSIKNIFHRPDKQRANDMDAVANIIQSSIKPSDDTSNILRTEIWRWSNALRTSLYSFAQRQIKDRGVILDIGTGDGQSLDAIISMKDVSFIFVEPNPISCKKLISKLGIKKYHRDPRSVIPIVPQLRKGTAKYHVLNCPIEEIVNDEATMQNLKYIVSHVTSCFSAQFAINELSYMASIDMSVIGCCYLYDDVEPGLSIINHHGLKMSRIDFTHAQVKWGSDKVYDEPALETSDIPESLVKIRATDLVGFPSESHDGIVRHVSSHAWILRSR